MRNFGEKVSHYARAKHFCTLTPVLTHVHVLISFDNAGILPHFIALFKNAKKKSCVGSGTQYSHVDKGPTVCLQAGLFGRCRPVASGD